MDELQTVARTIWGEARGESDQGRIAVAWVIRNRAARGGWWGGTPTEVCRKPYQFSCWNPDDPNRMKISRLRNDDLALMNCLWVALSVFLDKVPDPTFGSCHYAVVGTQAPWMEGKTPVCVIGQHMFFNDIDS